MGAGIPRRRASWGSAPTLIFAASLATRRRRCLGATPFWGGDGDGVDPLGVSTVAPLVTVSAVTFMRTAKVARNVLR